MNESIEQSIIDKYMSGLSELDVAIAMELDTHYVGGVIRGHIISISACQNYPQVSRFRTPVSTTFNAETHEIIVVCNDGTIWASNRGISLQIGDLRSAAGYIL